MNTDQNGTCGCAGGDDSRAQAEKTKEFVREVRQAGGKPAPSIDFNTFVISLASSVMFHLGKGPLPDGRKGEVNLEMAQQTIEIIHMLQEKTRGNLTSEEAELLCNVIYDLRLRYVNTLREVKKGA